MERLLFSFFNNGQHINHWIIFKEDNEGEEWAMSIFEGKTNREIENQRDKTWGRNMPCMFRKHPDGQYSWSRLRHHLVDNFNNFHFYSNRNREPVQGFWAKEW